MPARIWCIESRPRIAGDGADWEVTATFRTANQAHAKMDWMDQKWPDTERRVQPYIRQEVGKAGNTK